jgi:hypothetical protein
MRARSNDPLYSVAIYSGRDFVAGAVSVLHRRAEAQRAIAAAGTSYADHRGRPIPIRSPEAAMAARNAGEWESVALEIAGIGEASP